MIVFEARGKGYKANFHLHTTASDGVISPDQALSAYENQEYEVLAITDHRRVTDTPGYQGEMLLLPGIEWDMETWQAEVIHLLGIGMN